MTDLVHVLAIGTSAGFLVVVFELVRRRVLTEEYSFLWLACGSALLALSLSREMLHQIARWLGVYYPPAVLLLVLFLFVLATSLHFSVTLSRQRRQIERLTEALGILEARLREQEAGSKDPAGPSRAA